MKCEAEAETEAGTGVAAGAEAGAEDEDKDEDEDEVEHRKRGSDSEGVLYFVMNDTYGGFGLSDSCLRWLNDRVQREDGSRVGYGDFRNLEGRCNPHLVAAVRHFGSKRASGRYAKLAIERVTYDASVLSREEVIDALEVDEYDGAESLACNRDSIIASRALSGECSSEELNIIRDAVWGIQIDYDETLKEEESKSND